jgi:hypothetical protein
LEKKKVGQAESEWKALWETSDGRAFKSALALMFTQCRPNTVPSEADARAYWLKVRHIVEEWGLGPVVEGFDKASSSTAADEWRPSAGMVLAQTLKAAARYAEKWLASRALPAKKYEPPTPEQLAEIREDIKRMPRGPVLAVLKTAVGR